MTLSTRSLLRPLALAIAALGACTAGAAPYSIDPGGATVTDQATALQWARCSLGQSWDGSTCTGPIKAYTWQNALQAAQAANAASHLGYSDWRLPNVAELESVVDVDAPNPAIDLAAFPGTAGGGYWSSTSYAATATAAWYVYLYNGHLFPIDKSNINYVRLVRSGQSTAAFDALAAPGPGPGAPGAPQPVPALGEWALALLVALLGVAGLRRRRKG